MYAIRSYYAQAGVDGGNAAHAAELGRAVVDPDVAGDLAGRRLVVQNGAKRRHAAGGDRFVGAARFVQRNAEIGVRQA